jgi:hypothetical protein
VLVAPPTSAHADVLLSQGRPATASSTENAGTAAADAVDGDTGTRWSSAFSDPQWIQVDLGATATINRVVLNWEAAYATAYQVRPEVQRHLERPGRPHHLLPERTALRPAEQAAYMNGSTRGYAAYKVANSVTTHEAWDVGSYCYFNVDPSIVADRGFEVPNTPGVRFHNLLTVSLGGNGTIANVINTTGGPASGTATIPSYLVSYP